MKSFKKPSRFDYNMVVIGAGAAGLVSSYLAAALKAKVALIEKHKMGGDCLNTGCVPSKALIRSAKMLSYAKRAQDFGFRSTTIDFDFAEVMERVQKVVKKIEPHDSVERYTGLGVECIQGEAKILSPWEVAVNGRTLTTKAIIIATGARPFVPPIPGLEQIPFLTSDSLWNIRELPKRMVVLGGGPIGCEIAQCFQRFGSQVTLVEMAPRIMAREDEDVSEAVSKKLSSEGMNLLTNHKAKAFEIRGGQKTLIAEHQGKDVAIEFDQLLVAIGRKANVTGFGLEDLGVTISPRGTVQVDEFLCTNYPNIFVCGDVAGPYQFTHTAAHQAYYACVNALFRPFLKLIPPPFNKGFKVNYSVIPWATYTDPEVATVGLTETAAKEKGIAYELTTYGIDDLDRAIADEEDHGFVKVLTKPGTDTILGATIVGYHASDLISEFIAAMKNGFGLNSILGTIHIYPTMAEANKYLAGNWKRERKPEGILNWLARFHAWRRG
ncbi:MAG: dihydrolipoyl dehydrogenase [Bdellovibrionales bacterium]|nr:dihydrolipoyl dehydrogenase [Bdellovibrionales bacterium]